MQYYTRAIKLPNTEKNHKKSLKNFENFLDRLKISI